MKWLKKIADTPLDIKAKVIDSLSGSSNINAPSIRAVNEAIANKWQDIYPVGSIYMSVNNANPSQVFGGTWQPIKDKFLLASGDIYNNGATGGSATNTLTTNQLPSHNHSYTRATGVGDHTLTTNEIPSHSHGYSIAKFLQEVETGGGGFSVNVSSNTDAATSGNTGGGQAHNHPLNTDTPNTGNTGSGAAINNMPPYLAVNVWVRTA
jgi:microcystin-dependent protein